MGREELALRREHGAYEGARGSRSHGVDQLPRGPLQEVLRFARRHECWCQRVLWKLGDVDGGFDGGPRGQGLLLLARFLLRAFPKNRRGAREGLRGWAILEGTLGGSACAAPWEWGTGRNTGLNSLSFSQPLPGTSLSLLGALDTLFRIHDLHRDFRCYSGRVRAGCIYGESKCPGETSGFGHIGLEQRKPSPGQCWFFLFLFLQVSLAVSGLRASHGGSSYSRG